MLPDDHDMTKTVKTFSVAAQSSTISASVGICFDQGRVAAMNGFKVNANPYFIDSEPAGYQAWLDGFNQQKVQCR